MNNRVIVGLSGGVDSAVAAHLLVEEGYDVTAVFMNNWADDDEFCTAEADFNDVKKIASALKIPYYSVNYSKEYYARVFEYFLAELKAGRTPNPDVLCNREIKFGSFLDLARGLGASFIATGHYCGVEKAAGITRLVRATDEGKDQTYFLNQLNQEQLRHALFPLARLQKSEVRAIARKRGIPVFDKKDSTGICFIGERKFKEFLKGFLPACPGDIVTAEGQVVGRHEGLMYYTLGQRRGLNIGGLPDGQGRWFVVEKRLAENRLIVCRTEKAVLFSSGAECSEFNWIEGAPPARDFNALCRLRHRQPLFPVRVEAGKSVRLVFDKPQRAVTEGQYAVLYDGIYCLGGGAVSTKWN